MGEYDLAGYDDCDGSYTEIDVDSEEHLRQTAYHAVATRRGTDQETEDLKGRWLDVTQFLQGRGSIVGRIRGALAGSGHDLEQVDERVQRAVYTVAELADGTVQWTAEITAKATTALVSAVVSPFPQDVPREPPPPAGPPAIEPPGIRTLRQFALDTSHVIGWLTGPNSGRYLWTLGLACDAAIEWLQLGIQQRMPDYAALDALPWIGRDRGIRRGLRESTESYRVRLKAWRQTWARVGLPWAILSQAQTYFLPETPVVRTVEHDPNGATRATWCTRGADGSETFHVASPSNWDWDSADPLRPAKLATRDPRFWIIVYQDPDDGLFELDQSSPIQVYDFAEFLSLGDDEKGRDLDLFGTTWKSAGSWCAGVIVAYDPTLFDPTGSGADYPDGTWHEYADPVTHEPNRAMPARYLEMQNSPGNVGV